MPLSRSRHYWKHGYLHGLVTSPAKCLKYLRHQDIEIIINNLVRFISLRGVYWAVSVGALSLTLVRCSGFVNMNWALQFGFLVGLTLEKNAQILGLIIVFAGQIYLRKTYSRLRVSNMRV